jgi:hypothetical protein
MRFKVRTRPFAPQESAVRDSAGSGLNGNPPDSSGTFVTLRLVKSTPVLLVIDFDNHTDTGERPVKKANAAAKSCERFRRLSSR